MNSRSLLSLGLLLTLTSTWASDWAAWRGPNANGIAAAGQDTPTQWDETTNIVWKAEVPGRGHSSPVVVGDRIFLTTADDEAKTQSVLAYDRASGEKLWQTQVYQGVFPGQIHKKNTHASPTVASDGERVFAVFNNDGVFLAVLDVEGNPLWSKKVGGYQPRYPFGYAPSPLLYGDTVIVSSEFEPDGFIAAYDKVSGEEVWRTPRNTATSYSSPIVATIDGKDQLLLSGANKVSSYDPKTGSLLWAANGGPSATCGTVVWLDGLAFASGGYPEKETVAVHTDGSAKVAWTNSEKSYEQSMLAANGHLYTVTDAGIAICWRASDGKEMWKERLPGGPISASPVMVNDRIYATNEAGTTFIFKSDPAQFELVATNKLGDEAFATPAYVDNRIYKRVSHQTSGGLQEMLYCIGE